MRVLEEPIRVWTRNITPTLIKRGHSVYHVKRLMNYWVIQGKWWVNEERRLYMRLETDRGMMEIFCRENEWILSKIWD